jgi:DNA-binding MarR family transcriptional regulator
VSHPTTALDDVVHQRVRLGILAVLADARVADFNYLRETLSVTDGNLSRHLQVLESAGCVEISKVFEGKRPRTWVKATRRGRDAYARELAALRALVSAHG